MCHKLFQIYACNHSRVVCTTPCPHALQTGTRIPINSAPGVSRSTSTVSSIVPSVRRSAVDDLASRQQQQRLPMRSPLRMSLPAARDLPPAFRFLPSPTIPTGPPPGYPGHSPTSPVSPTSTWSVSPTTPDAALPDEEYTIEPNFCSYYFPRCLPQSNQPCLECYMLPAWEQHPRDWVKHYQREHFGDKQGDEERLSGVEELRKKHEERMREGV